MRTSEKISRLEADRMNADMLGALLTKMAFVLEIRDSTGTTMNAAIEEIRRQMKQVAEGIPVTKSGIED